MRSEEEIKGRVSEIEFIRHDTFCQCKSQGSANLRISKFYNYAIEQLLWVLNDEH